MKKLQASQPGTELPVHPAADIFPMMSEEDLADLAEDIKANGLMDAIVIDAEGQLVDGRNRHAACVLAGIEPRFEQLNGRDPLAFIASKNLKRRNLTKGQQAMAYAMLYPEPEKGGRGKKRNSSETEGFSAARLSQARSVLAFSRELADSVRDGVTPLDKALKTVEDERQRAESDSSRLERLRKEAPDLAVLVDEERISLIGAVDEWNRRERDRRAIYQAGAFALRNRLGQFSSNVLAIITGAAVQDDRDPLVVTDEAFKDAEDALKLLKRFKEEQKSMPRSKQDTNKALLEKVKQAAPKQPDGAPLKKDLVLQLEPLISSRTDKNLSRTPRKVR